MTGRSYHTPLRGAVVLGAALAVVASCTVAGAAAPLAKKPAPRKGGTLTLALSAGWDVLDPATTAFTFSREIMNLIYDPLLRRNPKTGKIVPGLAQSYAVSKDQKTIVLHLRKNVKFQDGTPFNAKAVLFSFRRILNPALKSPWAATIAGPVKNFKAAGKYTVVFKLKKPFAPFLDSLTQISLAPVSPAGVAKFGANFGAHPVGTGPFRVVSESPNNKVVLARNPSYHWAPAYEKRQGPAYLKKIVITDVSESATRMGLIATKAVNIVYNPDVTQIPQYQHNSQYKVLFAPEPGMPRSIVLNTQKFPTNDPKVRLAIAYAIDKKAILQAAYGGVGGVANNILSPTVPGYSGAVAKTWPKYNPAKAKAVLAADGWTPGKGGILTKNGQRLEMNYGTITGGTNFVVEDQIIQQNLKDVGIAINIQNEEQGAYLSDLRAGKWPISGMLFVATDPDVLYTVLDSASIGTAWNTAFYKNSTMDALLAKGRATTNPVKRAQIYAKAEALVAKDNPYVPYYDITNPFILTANVMGFKFDRQGFWDMYNTWLR